MVSDSLQGQLAQLDLADGERLGARADEMLPDVATVGGERRFAQALLLDQGQPSVAQVLRQGHLLRWQVVPLAELRERLRPRELGVCLRCVPALHDLTPLLRVAHCAAALGAGCETF